MTRSIAISGVLILALAIAAGAQESSEPSQVEKEQIEAALKLTREAAGKYKFAVGSDESTPTKLLEGPVLRWSNPNVGEIYGNVFLWTRNSRPVAVGSLFKWFSPHKHTSHEFHSLAEQRLTASYDGRDVWATKEAGVKFVSLDKVEPPADTPNRRLVQMRQIAKRFRGEERSRVDDKNNKGDDYVLRLLPQPIYRYEAEQEDVVDGAMFAFVQGTDPEILLQLEARKQKDGSLRWCFAAARMQNVLVRLKFDDREVWSVPQLEWSVAFDHTQTYTLFDTPGK